MITPPHRYLKSICVSAAFLPRCYRPTASEGEAIGWLFQRSYNDPIKAEGVASDWFARWQ
jgi:hypothetical protein